MKVDTKVYKYVKSHNCKVYISKIDIGVNTEHWMTIEKILKTELHDIVVNVYDINCNEINSIDDELKIIDNKEEYNNELEEDIINDLSNIEDSSEELQWSKNL